jgi:DNA-binding MarR family transcriptional regulator
VIDERAPQAELVEITRSVRLLFHRLRALGELVHASDGISVPMRGVLETLADRGPCTVPRMARLRPVSRQHIQRTVDALRAAGMVRLDPNPDHQRSPRVAMTSAGRAAYQRLQRRESGRFERLAEGISAKRLATTRSVLALLAARLDEQRSGHGAGETDETD